MKLIVANFSQEINEKLTIPNLTVWMNDPTLVDIKLKSDFLWPSSPPLTLSSPIPYLQAF